MPGFLLASISLIGGTYLIFPCSTLVDRTGDAKASDALGNRVSVIAPAHAPRARASPAIAGRCDAP